MYKVLALLLCYSVSDVTAYMPIPKREVGFVYARGSAEAPVHLDAYLDLACPGSKQALPSLINVADHYGPKTVRLTSHIFPLPYHRIAFGSAKGAHIVNSLSDLNTTYRWIDVVYNNYDSFTNKATFKFSEEQLVTFAEGI